MDDSIAFLPIPLNSIGPVSEKIIIKEGYLDKIQENNFLRYFGPALLTVKMVDGGYAKYYGHIDFKDIKKYSSNRLYRLYTYKNDKKIPFIKKYPIVLFLCEVGKECQSIEDHVKRRVKVEEFSYLFVLMLFTFAVIFSIPLYDTYDSRKNEC